MYLGVKDHVMSCPHFITGLTDIYGLTPDLRQTQTYLADHFTVIQSNIKFVLDRKIHEAILIKILNPSINDQLDTKRLALF